MVSKKYATQAKLQTIEGMRPTLNFRIAQASILPTNSTLKIPARYRLYFENQCKQFGGCPAYFLSLLQRGLPVLKAFASKLNRVGESKWKVRYQKSGQKLIKRNFASDPVAWELLRNAAQCVGVSMCFLFVFLMELEMDGHLNDKPDSGENQFLNGNSPLQTSIMPKKLRYFSDFRRVLEDRGKHLRRKLGR